METTKLEGVTTAVKNQTDVWGATLVVARMAQSLRIASLEKPDQYATRPGSHELPFDTSRSVS